MSIPGLPFKVRTKVSWPGEEEGDLGFIENEVIEVYLVVDDSWWSGKLRRNNKEGIFPKDYVEIIEEKIPHSSSSRSLNASGQGTPIKEELRVSQANKSGYYSALKMSPKKSNPLNQPPDHSYEEDDYDASFDRSFHRKSQSPRRDDYRYSPTPDAYRNSIGATDSYRSKPKSKRPTSFQAYDRSMSLPERERFERFEREKFERERYEREKDRYERERARKARQDLDKYEKAAPYQYLPEKVLLPGYKDRRYEFDDEEELAIAKQRLEMELQKIRMYESRKRLMRLPGKEYDESGYVSEDLVSSKKNLSKEDLGRKLRAASDDDDDDEYPPPLPPKRDSPTRVPFDADDFQISVDDEFRSSQQRPEALKNSIQSLQSDVLNLSELSATSAGSFYRHKWEKQQQLNEYRLKGLTIEEELGHEPDRLVMDLVFQEKKSGFLQKFLKKKTSENLLEQRVKQEPLDWTTLKVELNRMNSLTSYDKQQRTKRTTREESKLIIKPLDYISEINVNETQGVVDEDDQVQLDFENVSFAKPDAFIGKYDTLINFNDLISDISVKFGSLKLHQVRCVLLHLCKFNIVEEPNKISQTKPRLSELLETGQATIYQLNYLFKKILDALRIPSELILGFWKKPNEFYHIEQFVVNHCWLSVLLEHKIYIMDLYCFKNALVCNLRDVSYNEYYFLTKPLAVASTHIPSIITLQHVVPPIDQTIAFYLPRVYSGFHKNQLNFRNYNNALTRLKDLEIFELELDIPTSAELFTLIKTAKVTTNELSLCQVTWKGNQRIAKIKAVLPEKESIGVLQIFAGPKGLQKHFDNIHELAIVIPLYHTGSSKPGKFVPRFPTVQSQNNDLYVKQPQTSKIIAKNSYNFEIFQHPSQGVNSGSGLMNQDFKLVVESPLGKYYKLTKDDSLPYGVYETNIKCQELGTYRGLVIGDSGNSWYVFAQWDCVASS